MKYLLTGAIITTLATFLSCSNHPFDNPLDPDNSGEIDEYVLMFRCPTDTPSDLAWDGFFLWVSDYINNELIQISPYDGSIAERMSMSCQGPAGLTVTDDSFWVATPASQRIRELDFLTGREVYSFSSPGSNPQGLTFGDEERTIYNVDANSLLIYSMKTTTGEITGHIPSPSQAPRGLTWTGTSLYVAGFTENTIYAVDPMNGHIQDEIQGPHLAPLGLTWDGQALWVIDWDLHIYRRTLSIP
ncbi:hypothetical protein JXQ70_08720 [bacterium]|nr:hypothetical protein [bacterium]